MHTSCTRLLSSSVIFPLSLSSSLFPHVLSDRNSYLPPSDLALAVLTAISNIITAIWLFTLARFWGGVVVSAIFAIVYAGLLVTSVLFSPPSSLLFSTFFWCYFSFSNKRFRDGRAGSHLVCLECLVASVPTTRVIPPLSSPAPPTLALFVSITFMCPYVRMKCINPSDCCAYFLGSTPPDAEHF